MTERVSGLLCSKEAGEQYCSLFNLRSTFLHGREMINPIPGERRLMARRLARKVVQKLVEAALKQPPPGSREEFLNRLDS